MTNPSNKNNGIRSAPGNRGSEINAQGGIVGTGIQNSWKYSFLLANGNFPPPPASIEVPAALTLAVTCKAPKPRGLKPALKQRAQMVPLATSQVLDIGMDPGPQPAPLLPG
jgi:hypothetical protein